MCGLLATSSSKFAASSGWSRGLETLTCRGPDSHGAVDVGPLALGHRRLEIIGLGGPGRQPFQDAEGNGLVYNGEIYNYGELAAEIGIGADSDTHVLFELLRRRDLARLRRMRGMYGFVFWRAEDQTIVTARDPFGIKPLYVLRHPDGELSFSSVPAALAFSRDGGGPSPEAIAGFLAGGFFPSGTSPFENIRKIRPGVLHSWRRRDSRWVETGQALGSDQWAQMDTEHALNDSVESHLVADVPVGILLSGGVDSTLLAALVCARTTGLRSYSLTNPEANHLDEARYAKWNAGLLGMRHTEVPATPSSLAAQMHPLISSSGEPFSDPGFLALSLLCDRVSRDLKVVLAGEGADELYAGYRRYDFERHVYSLPGKVLLGLGARAARGFHRYQAGVPTQVTRTLASWQRGPGLLGHHDLIYGEWDAMGQAVPAGTEAALRRAQDNWAELDTNPLVTGVPPYRAFDLAQWMTNVYLEKSDRASMLHGLEVRVPYLDPVVARSARVHAPRDSEKKPLRQLLMKLQPEVRLPQRKMGLSIDTPAVLRDPLAHGRASRQLRDPDSVLNAIGLRRPDVLARRGKLNHYFALRLAALDMWQEIWIG